MFYLYARQVLEKVLNRRGLNLTIGVAIAHYCSVMDDKLFSRIKYIFFEDLNSSSVFDRLWVRTRVSYRGAFV